MRVLLISPRAGFLAEPAYVPPLGLLYLGAALEQAGHEACVVDLNLEGAAIAGYNPGLIGVTCTTATFPAARQVIAECRRLYPGVRIAAGGPHLSVRPQDYERLGADCSVAGDGEQWIVALASRDRGAIAGVDVNAVPIPARHLLPMDRYRCTLDGERATTVVTQRGCPFACAFCSRWEGTRKVRARCVENVIEEIRQLKAAGYRSLVFHDDEMNVVGLRLLALCRALAPEGIRFRANARADLLTEQQIYALAEAGCTWLCVGVESGNAEILKAANKGTTPEINARARKLCRAAGIKFRAFVIVGLPGETHQTVKDTRRWLLENEVDDLTITMFVPYPGSAIYERGDRAPLPYEDEALTFRGAAGLRLPRVTSTAEIPADEMVELPEWLESEVRSALGIGRTYAA